jgi:hypothetical protein
MRWERNDDISTFMASHVRYGSETGVADEQLRKPLLEGTAGLLGIRKWTESAYDRAGEKGSIGASAIIAAFEECCSKGADSGMISLD